MGFFYVIAASEPQSPIDQSLFCFMEVPGQARQFKAQCH